MRLLLRLVILALAGYGVKALYDRYGTHAGELQRPASEFIDRASSALGRSAEQARGSVAGAAAEVRDAAAGLGDELSRATTDATSEMSAAVDNATR
jgi:hypothetical protein